jgi:hypothetical protein
MIECYTLPTARPYLVTGTYYIRTNGVTSAGVTIPNIVLFEKNEYVENKFVGIIRKVQISTTSLATRPDRTSKLVIAGQEYSFKDPIKRQNPMFIDFWESEIKAI